jgi:hypothetical protein
MSLYRKGRDDRSVLRVAARSLEGSPSLVRHEPIGDAAGLPLILLGSAVIVTIRFCRTERDSDAAETISVYSGGLHMVGMLLLGARLLACLFFAILRRPL